MHLRGIWVSFFCHTQNCIHTQCSHDCIQELLLLGVGDTWDKSWISYMQGKFPIYCTMSPTLHLGYSWQF